MPRTRSKKYDEDDESTGSNYYVFDTSSVPSIPSIPETEEVDATNEPLDPEDNDSDSEPETEEKRMKMPAKGPDAPENESSIRTLVSKDELRKRDMPIQLPTRIMEIPSKKAYFIQVHMLHGQKASDWAVMRKKDDKRTIILRHRNSCPDTEAFLDTFCTGKEVEVKHGSFPIWLNESDMFVSSCCDELDAFNGSARNEDPAKLVQAITLDYPVKAMTSGFAARDYQGEF